MKTTLEISGHLLALAELEAKQLGILFDEFVVLALEEKLAKTASTDGKPWMASFGQLRDLHEENMRIDRVIEEEFGQIEPEDLR